MAQLGRVGTGRKRVRIRTRNLFRIGALTLVAIWAALVTPAPGQNPLPNSSTKVYFDTSHKADADLRSADNHARAGDFAETIDIYQRVIQQFGDKMVDVALEPSKEGEPESRLSVNARLECQRRIAALPPEARAIYRSRVDSQAERWFQQGKANRDRTLLRRVVDQTFCSSWGDDALELLGDLAFQEGDFAEAMAAYSRLVPDRPLGAAGLVHPDPSFDPARVEAKKLLCRAAIGINPPSPAELESFAQAHPQSPGPFAGRKGKLAADLTDSIRDDHLAPPSLTDGRWPTFAGSPTRTRIAPGPIDVGSLQWKAELEQINPTRSRGYGRMNMGMGGMGNTGVQPAPEKLLAYHPIVVGDQVMVVNEKQITAYNLNTRPGDREAPVAPSGAVEVAWKTTDLVGLSSPPRPNPGLGRYTLTAFGDRIFARVGPPPSTSPQRAMGMGGISPPSPSFIVAVDRSTQGKLLWKREASEIPLPKRQLGAGVGSKNAVFEGTPVADAQNVYVAITDRIEMTASYIACLDAESGSTRWVRYICEANANIAPFSSVSFEISHRLVTLDGPTLYYQTNLGAVASLDAETGSVRWLATYPWQGPNGAGSGRERDINPAIIHDGLVIVSPDDTKRIYAFEAATGRLAWQTEEISEEVKLTHLLGVAQGKLIATGDKVLGFDVKTGKKSFAWPDNAVGTQGFGRGILAGNRIYWPTKTEIHILDQETGLIADPPIKLLETFQCEGGNLAVGDGYLIVAQAKELVVFCQNSRLIDRYRDEIARSPDQAANYYRLAQAAEAIGRDDLALTSLETALPRARASESIDGSPLVEVIRDHQRQLLMKLGRKARVARDWNEAGRRFAAAAEFARVDRDRLAALLDLADVQLARGDARASVATLQGLLSDERVRSLSIDAADGHRSVRADLLIADRIASLLRENGRGLYADFDRAAADLLARGKAEKDPGLLEDVGRSYPVAQVVPEALIELGAVYEARKRPGDSARVYKKLLSLAPDDPTRATALWGLARSYEAQKLWVSAREAYLQATRRFGTEPILSAGAATPRPLAALVAERLARSPFDRMAADRAEPVVPVPLRRRWERHWAATSRPLAADGIPPSAESGRVFLARGTEIRPLDPATGESAWSRNLDGEPIWVGYLADRIIAATKTRMVALTLDKGQVEWSYDLGVAPRGGPANPFAREPAPDGADLPGQLLDFRIIGNRIFCVRGHPARLPVGGEPELVIQAIMAFDGDTGLVDWSYTPPTGRINRHLIVGPRRIVLQVRKPNQVLVLDTATGRRQGVFPQGEAEEWPRDPIGLDDDHVGLVVNRTKVANFDTTKGTYAWEFEESKDSPRLGPPRLFSDSERLLVLHEGQNLMRLDPVTGSKLWKNWRLLGNEDLSERPEALALAPDTVFVANGSTLSAFAEADGRLLWKRPLSGPSNGWDLALTERSVVAFPGPLKIAEDDLSAFPLVFLRRADGEPIQRLLFQSPVTQLAIRFSSRGALVATQTTGWAIGDRQVMDGSRAPR